MTLVKRRELGYELRTPETSFVWFGFVFLFLLFAFPMREKMALKVLRVASFCGETHSLSNLN